ncbi:MAG: hypothetical protein H0U70_03060 [Tatlockia sp.]|nr:hypothetical protein [Tatlockia sp.]
MILIKILALIGSWILFFKLLKSRNKKFAGIKATLITLLFASLIFRFSTDLYALVNKTFFTFNKQGEIKLSESPLKIPIGQDGIYCNQFTNQENKPLQKISERSDGRYCGEFWRFERDKNLMIPYKINNLNQVIYWASPSLRIVGSKQNLDKTLNQTNLVNPKQ